MKTSQTKFKNASQTSSSSCYEQQVHGEMENHEHMESKALKISEDTESRVAFDDIDCYVSDRGYQYKPLSIIGQGVFGHVIKCKVKLPNPKFRQDKYRSQSGAGDEDFSILMDGLSFDRFKEEEIPELVAVKVLKNKPAYFKQGLVEVKLLESLQEEDYAEHFPIVKLYDHFVCVYARNGQRCLVFELLSIDLLELYRSYEFLHGIPMKMLKPIAKQLVFGLEILAENSVIHCDIKPENILLVGNNFDENIKVKIIDFGSSCLENGALYSNIQTIFYRAPEVILGFPYDCSIDMWSLGCVLLELFAGFPLFPGTTDHEMLQLITHTLGDLPEKMVKQSRYLEKYFTVEDGVATLQTRNQYYVGDRAPPPKAANSVFQDKGNITDIVINWRYKQIEQTLEDDLNLRHSFADFCSGLLCCNPSKRWSAWQIKDHPFIMNEDFIRPFIPPAQAQWHHSRARDISKPSRLSTSSRSIIHPFISSDTASPWQYNFSPPTRPHDPYALGYYVPPNTRDLEETNLASTFGQNPINIASNSEQMRIHPTWKFEAYVGSCPPEERVLNGNYNKTNSKPELKIQRSIRQRQSGHLEKPKSIF